jgi:hypothetical protein
MPSDLPAREDRRGSQSSSNRTIRHHEHLGLITVFGKIPLLNAHCSNDDKAKEHRKANDDAVAVGLSEKLDGHLGLWGSIHDRGVRQGNILLQEQSATLYETGRGGVPTVGVVSKVL